MRRRFTPLLLISIASSAWLAFRPEIYQLSIGLDASWIYAINDAAATGRRWGRDIVWTHGPLGYLVHPLNLMGLGTRSSIADIGFAIGCGVVVALYLDGLPRLGRWTRVTLALALVYSIAVQTIEYRWFGIFVLTALAGVHLPKREGLFLHAAGGLTAGCLLLVKFSIGFGAVGTILVCSALADRWRIALLRVAIAVGSVATGLLAGWVWLYRDTRWLSTYIRTGWEISTGYSSAMSLEPPRWWINAGAYGTFSVLLLAWAVIQRSRRTTFSSIAVSIPLFVAWKHAMVRQDDHVWLFGGVGLFLVLILLVDAMLAFGRPRALLGSGLLLVPLIFPWTLPGAPVKRLPEALLAPFASPATRLRDVTHQRAAAAQSLANVGARILPASLRRQIADESVDIYPWEATYVVANQLRWSSRPIPGSYAAYRPSLDALDAAFFESARGPRYLVWHMEGGFASIDGRYLLWDEPVTALTIWRRYRWVATEGGLALLELRAPAPAATIAAGLRRDVVRWGEWVPVPEFPGSVVVSIDLHRSFAARFVRWSFREAPVWLSVRFTSGEEVTYRVVPDNMTQGLLVSPLPITVEEIASFLMHRQSPRRVAALRLSTGWAGLFGRRIAMSWSGVQDLGPSSRDVP